MMQADKQVGRQHSQRGFALIEVMIAMVILTVGMCAVLASFGLAITATESAQEDLIARQKALDALESIYTARNSQQIPFAAIQNVGAGGIFLSGPQPLLCAGPTYGIVGVSGDTTACKTASGAACPNGGVECMVLPGPDGVLGSGTDANLESQQFHPHHRLQSCRSPRRPGRRRQLEPHRRHRDRHLYQTQLASPQLRREWADL